MRIPVARFSLRWLLVFVALVGLLLGAERFWRRSEHYRMQAALCAYFEIQHRFHAASAMKEDEREGWTIEDKKETAKGNLIESDRFGRLKEIYQRIARHSWVTLPPDTPISVNGWDLGLLSASEIEEMVRDRQAE